LSLVGSRLGRLILNLILYLLLLLQLVFYSCSEKGNDNILSLALQTEPGTLDPAFSVDYTSGLIVSLIHSNLFRFDVDGVIVEDLVSGYSVDSSGTLYRLEIGEAYFSNGRKVTAGDVVYSFRRLLSPETHSPRWWVLKDVAGAREFHSGISSDLPGLICRGDSEVIIKLERPIAHFPALLAMPSCGVVAREVVESQGKNYGRYPCGSGPWLLRHWREGDELLLERNPYFKGKVPDVEGISFRVIPESMTRIAEFETGNLDLLEVPRAEIVRWKGKHPLVEREELRIVYIGLNNESSPFSDRRVRRALNMAIDIDAIIKYVLFGSAKRADGIVPSPLRGNYSTLEPYRYDPERARELLSKAGYPRGFKMQIWQRENPESGRVLESIQGYLAEVGIDVEIVTREWSAFKEAVDRGTCDAFYLDWFADYPDCENFLYPLFHSSNFGGRGNRSHYSNAVVDSLLDLASMTIDSKARRELYFQAEKIIYEDAPWIFLWFPVRFIAVSSRVHNYREPIIFNGQRFLDVYLD